DKPRTQATQRIIVMPMLRLGNGLSVQLERELGVTRFENLSVEVLMTGDAGVAAHVEAAQVAHTRAHARGIGPIFARVTAQPRFGRTVTTFARDAFVRTRVRPEPHRRD